MGPGEKSKREVLKANIKASGARERVTLLSSNGHKKESRVTSKTNRSYQNVVYNQPSALKKRLSLTSCSTWMPASRTEHSRLSTI